MPDDIDVKTLSRQVRAELRGLPTELADVVAGHLVAAGRLIDDDPALAFAHAEAARRRAARLPIVREASAETAYAAGEYAHALSEYRALRRMTGDQSYLPVMADCERALGRAQAALQLVREGASAGLPLEGQVELIIVEAGARDDLGQTDEALRLLRAATGRYHRPAASAARLQYAYADLLVRTGDETQARARFAAAAELDVDGATDAAERADELDGLIIQTVEVGEPEANPTEQATSEQETGAEPDELGRPDDADGQDGADGRDDAGPQNGTDRHNDGSGQDASEDRRE